VNVTLAIASTSMPCADNNTICARRPLPTDPEHQTHDPQQPIALLPGALPSLVSDTNGYEPAKAAGFVIGQPYASANGPDGRALRVVDHIDATPLWATSW
jgi:hypothetical protein